MMNFFREMGFYFWPLALIAIAAALVPPLATSGLFLSLGEVSLAIGAALVAHPRIDGVAFTGSTGTARAINRSLAEKDGPIVPLIAETGAKPIGTFVMGTVKGDIHSIGKDICVSLLESQGFDVEDLGVDVEVETVAEAAAPNCSPSKDCGCQYRKSIHRN